MKTHYSRSGEVVVAVCDEELIGRRLKLPTGVMVEVAESFYKGVLVVERELADYIKMGTIINLLGEKAVSTAVKNGYAKRESVVYVDNVPHLQLFL
ncbi:MAG: DUF424 family protein [Candidatus Caldarchaeum sp.]|nr:DUF424 family protein [Candidatus Caldarchaeum sp.]MDW7977982.1 DUF424 family protein [Candidatus Caldarchaeum sp.]MDW8359790.1 DUF424 family protein [Candidatus Caldarchaeum sp.]